MGIGSQIISTWHIHTNSKGCFRCVIKLLMLKTETDSVVSHFTLGRNFIDIFYYLYKQWNSVKHTYVYISCRCPSRLLVVYLFLVILTRCHPPDAMAMFVTSDVGVRTGHTLVIQMLESLFLEFWGTSFSSKWLKQTLPALKFMSTICVFASSSIVVFSLSLPNSTIFLNQKSTSNTCGQHIGLSQQTSKRYTQHNTLLYKFSRNTFQRCKCEVFFHRRKDGSLTSKDLEHLVTRHGGCDGDFWGNGCPYVPYWWRCGMVHNWNTAHLKILIQGFEGHCLWVLLGHRSKVPGCKAIICSFTVHFKFSIFLSLIPVNVLIVQTWNHQHWRNIVPGANLSPWILNHASFGRGPGKKRFGEKGIHISGMCGHDVFRIRFGEFGSSKLAHFAWGKQPILWQLLGRDGISE